MDLNIDIATLMAKAAAFQIPLPAGELAAHADKAAEQAAEELVTAEICRDLGDDEGASASDHWSDVHFARHCALFNLLEETVGSL